MRSSLRTRRLDPTIYPVEEKVGEHILQRWIAESLRPALERWLAARGRLALVGADQFIYYKQHDPHCRVSPDVYVLPGVPPDTEVSVWKLWERGIPPSFCLEVVSRDWEKDYCEAPERYTAVGATELVIFDPVWMDRPEGLRWQVYRLLPRRGFVRVETTNGDRVRARTLGCWLRAVGNGMALRLRIATGPRGDDLVPTIEEGELAARQAEQAARAAERMAREAEQAAREAEQTAMASAQAERAAKEAALSRIAELEAKLSARIRTRRPR